MTKIIKLVLINLVTPKARAKHEPFVQQTGLWPSTEVLKRIKPALLQEDQLDKFNTSQNNWGGFQLEIKMGVTINLKLKICFSFSFKAKCVGNVWVGMKKLRHWKIESESFMIWCEIWGCIIRRVQPFYEWAVTNLGP